MEGLRVSRRDLFGAAAIGASVLGSGVIASTALASTAAAASTEPPTAETQRSANTALGETVEFYGEHQAGIGAVDQAHEVLIALDLHPDTTRDDLRRMMRLISDDAARLTEGRAALADIEPELAQTPARLAVAFGFGARFVAVAGGEAPAWLGPLPEFAIDRLDPAVSDGDLLLLLAADDPLTLAHASRVLLRDCARYASARWTQQGFRRARTIGAKSKTMRNLFGQVDGTAGPHPGDSDYDEVVWIDSGWLSGGTSLVVRRIAMDLDDWDRVGRPDREHAVGRRLGNGGPVTGGDEFAEPDFDAVDDLGFTVIKPWAHIRRARTEDATQRFARRSFNYADGRIIGADTGNGLVFISAQADPISQFVPVQQRLAELDLMNRWTTPVGSAVFAVPAGCSRGGYIGETLLG